MFALKFEGACIHSRTVTTINGGVRRRYQSHIIIVIRSCSISNDGLYVTREMLLEMLVKFNSMENCMLETRLPLG